MPNRSTSSPGDRRPTPRLPGRAARQAEQAHPKPRRPRVTKVAATLPDGESAPERWLANIRMSGFTITILCLIVLGVVVLAPSFKLLIEQNTQIQDLQKSVADQKSKVGDLKGQVARWDDPAYIEAQARSRLLFVFPGDYSYLVTASGAQLATGDGAPISKTIQDTRVDWVKSLTSSLFTAGLSKAPSDTINSPVIGSGSGQTSPSTGAGDAGSGTAGSGAAGAGMTGAGQ